MSPSRKYLTGSWTAALRGAKRACKGGIFTSRLSEMAGESLDSLSCPLKVHVFLQYQLSRGPQQVDRICLQDSSGPCEAPGRARPSSSCPCSLWLWWERRRCPFMASGHAWDLMSTHGHRLLLPEPHTASYLHMHDLACNWPIYVPS